MLQHGIEKVIVVVGYRKEMLMEHLRDYPVTFIHNPFFDITNNMASLWFAAATLKDSFIYSHGDLVFDPSLMKLIIDSPYDTALLVEEKMCGEEEMKVIVRENNYIESSKQLHPSDSFGEWTGIAKISANFANLLVLKIGLLLEEGNLQSYDTHAFNQIARQGGEINVISFKDVQWMEIDTPEDLMAARAMFNLGGV